MNRLIPNQFWRMLSLLSCTVLVLVPQVAKATPQGQSMTITLSVNNQSEATICHVLIAATTAMEWGPDRLHGEQIKSGAIYSFTLTVGNYDVLLTNCANNILLDRHNMMLVADTELSLTQSDILLAGCDTYNEQGEQAVQRGRYPEAIVAFQTASACYHKIGDRIDEAVTLNNIGRVYIYQGQYAEAILQLEAALTIVRAVGSRADEGISLNNIAAAYSGQGRYGEALANLQRALEILRETGNRAGEAATLNTIATVYLSQGRYQEALTSLHQVLAIAREIGERVGEGVTLHNIAAVYSNQGRYGEALVSYQQALAIAQEIGDRASAGITLNNIAGVYLKQGRYEETLANYQQALAIAQEIGDRSTESTTLNGIGLMYLDQERYEEALAHFEQALGTIRKIGAHASESGTINNIAGVYRRQGLYEDALANYQQALAIAQEVGDRNTEGVTLNNIGLIERILGRYEDALTSYQRALVIRHKIGDQAGEGLTLIGIGTTYDRQGRVDDALVNYQPAMELIESVRTVAGSETGRASFIEQYLALYDRVIQLDFQQDKPTDAFLISERGRARSFLDSLATGQVELFDNAAANLLSHEKEAYAVRQSAQDALGRAKILRLPDPQLIANLEQQLVTARTVYTEALAAIQARSDRLADLVPGRNNNVLSLWQVQQQLDNQTTLISYWTLDDTTWAFVVTANHFMVIELPDAKLAVLRTTLQNLYTWSNRENPHPRSLRDLYRWLFAPIAEHIHTSHVAIVPHQLLHYVPFTALTDGKIYFGQQHTLTILPSASALPFLAQNEQAAQANHDGQAVVIGDPASNEMDLPRLHYAQAEATAVADILHTNALTDTAASEITLHTAAQDVRVIHLAAHGSYNQANALYSAIYLAPSQPLTLTHPLTSTKMITMVDTTLDGRLETHEIFGLTLKGNDLVVLSACQTNIGNLSRGDEIVGLTRAFFFAGAPTVIASLWSVDDAATETLMVSFYKHWLQDGMSKAQALQAAQADVRADPRWVSPFYWAGFVLNGDPGQRNHASSVK